MGRMVCACVLLHGIQDAAVFTCTRHALFNKKPEAVWLRPTPNDQESIILPVDIV
jgi:hypothetical protein